MLPLASQRRRTRAWPVGALTGLLAMLGVSAAAHASPPPAQRIVSLNPSLTAILVAIGARDALVGVDDYSAGITKEVADLPRVGGLYSPSLEAVVALRPDLVVLVPSAEQRDFRERTESLGIRVAVFENIRFDQVLENIERLGALTGRGAQARRRIEAIERTRAAAVRASVGRRSPRVLVVLQHDPVYVVGRGSFLAEMLDRLGGRNLGAEFDDPYPRVAIEWVVARGPEVLIDLSPDPDAAHAYWARWPSIPAVQNKRVLKLPSELISMPGPRLDEALLVLAVALYGEEAALQIRRESAP
jgi:iron complex transport system substrate-binding protein